MASFDKRPNGWSVRFRFGGKQIRLSGFQKKSDAEKAYRDYLINEREVSPVTFREMAEFYIKNHKNDVKESTIVSIQEVMKKIYPLIGDKPIDKLTCTDFDELKAELCNYSPNYKAKIWAHLSAVLNYAQTRYNCPAVFQFKRVEPIKRDRTKKDYWLPNEFRIFIKAVLDEYTASKDYIHYRYYILFNFLYMIGTRKGEMVALRWNDFDLENKTVLIDKSITTKLTDESRQKGYTYKVTDTKTHKGRLVDIPDQLNEMLIDYKKKEKAKDNDLVFFKDRPLDFNTLSRHLDYYINLSGVKRITPHQFRHSNASLIISNGGNNDLATAYVLAERLGNSKEMVLDVYGNLFESAKKDIVSKIKI